MKISLITYAPEIQINGNKEIHSIKYILDPFIEAFENSSPEHNQIEVINLDRMEIHECLGCSDNLFFVPKDNCRQTDDMNSIYPLLKDSDLWFFAFESNTYTPPKKILNFFDRLEPLFNEDFMEFYGKRKAQKKNGKIFLLSISALWENGVFDELSFQIQSLALLFHREILGQVLRPHYGAFIEYCNVYPDFHSEVFENIKKIANNIINSQNVEESTLRLLNTPVIERDEYVKRFSEVLSII